MILSYQTGDASVTSIHCLAKQKVSFVFRSTKDLQKMPLGKLSIFLHTLFLENEVQLNKINYRTMFFMSKQLSLPKISSILQKIKTGQKKRYTPFLHKSLQLFDQQSGLQPELDIKFPAISFADRLNQNIRLTA